MDEILKDERFAHIGKDPRFRSMSRKQKKVKIDKRFQSMFTDKRFKLKYSVDKRGRPLNFTTNENLKKYYELSDESDNDDKLSDEADDSFDEEDELLAKLTKKTKSKSNKEENFEQINKSTESNKTEDSFINNKLKSEPDKGTFTKHGKEKKLKKTKGDHGNDEVIDSNEEPSNRKGSNSTNVGKKAKTTSKVDSTGESESESEDTSDDDDAALTVGGDAPDYARGKGLIESSTDEDDDDESDADDSFDHQWGELDKNVAETDELSCRLALCNMDWDRIKSQDLFILFNSFKSVDGVIKSVHIYPSEFGLKRMKEEQIQGPTELKELAEEVDVDADVESEDDDEDNEGNRYHREKLRQYQLNRLKYYYAVVECDSVKTASKIYDECDGKEYESSSARLDLRYVPNDMTFDHPAKSECFTLPDSTSYNASTFFTSALCQSKVDLTWDETDQDRVRLTTKKYDKKGEINEDDFKAYLASGSEDEGQGYGDFVSHADSESVSDEDAQIEKYKSLLKDIDDVSNRKGDMEMEIEWEPGLKETTEDIIKTKEKSKDETPWQNYLKQKKEKKKQKKEEQKKKRLAKKEGSQKTFSDDELPEGVDLNDSFFTGLNTTESKSKKKKKRKKKNLTEEDEEKQKKKKEEAELALLMMDEGEEGRQHFSLNDLVENKKKKKKKRKKEIEEKTEDDFNMDFNDSRFNAVFKSHLFNIDPSAPEFKKTKAMGKLIEEKLKRRKEGSNDRGEKSKKVKLVAAVEQDREKDELMPLKEESLSSLVKSVKAKTQQFQTKKKKKK